jgi:hypothetical protein
MSKPKVYCTQCKHCRGFGRTKDRHGKTSATMIHRCWRGGYFHDYVENRRFKAYDNCWEKNFNKWGMCAYWKPKWIIRLLMWKPKWLGGKTL